MAEADRIVAGVNMTESTPLIASVGNTVDETTRRPQHRKSTSVASFASLPIPQARKPSTVVWIVCVIIFVVAGSGGFMVIPLTRVFEDIFCRQYYGVPQILGEPIDESQCKADEIQSKLAYLFAINNSLTAGVGCLAAMPWGIAADKYGRRPITAISLFGLGLGVVVALIVGWFPNLFAPEMMWFGSAMTFVGGGNAVLIATIYGSLADILPESERAIGFMRCHVASMLGNLVAPALASVLMPTTGPWPLLLAGTSVVFASVFSVGFLPETLHHSSTTDEETHHVGLKARLVQSLDSLKDSISILKNRSVILLLGIALLAVPAVSCTFQFLTLYTSKRYHIRLADTGYIQTIYGIAHIAIVLAVLPYISHVVRKPSTPAFFRIDDDRRRDLVLARISYASLALGTFVLAVSPALSGFILGLVIMSIGSGSGSLVKSLISLYVDPEHRSRLFTLYGILEVFSMMYSEPMLASLFTQGMRLGGFWMGLPYFGVCLTCIAMFSLVMFVRLPRTWEDTTDVESDHGSDTE